MQIVTLDAVAIFLKKHGHDDLVPLLHADLDVQATVINVDAETAERHQIALSFMAQIGEQLQRMSETCRL